MVAELFSVIRSENDNGVIVEFLFYQSQDQAADLMVQMCNAGILADLCLPDQFWIRRPGLGIKDLAVFLQVFFGLPAADKWFS